MRRRALLCGVVATAITKPRAVGRQQATKPWRVGYLSSSSAQRERTRIAAFREGLQELGYEEGRNILIEQRYAEGNFERLPGLAAELARLKVDMFLVAGVPATRAAQKTGHATPIVMTAVADPVAMGFAASLARPGGSITGLSDFPGVVVKRLEILKEVAPTMSQVAVIVNPTNLSNPPQLALIRTAAPRLGARLFAFEAKRGDEIDRAFRAITAARVDALVFIADPLLGSEAKRIVELAARNHLPAIYWSREFPDAGGLMSYGTNLDALWRRAATYVHKIFSGAKPADLPVEQATTPRLLWEFTHSHRTQGWLILESSSVSYGKATAFLPLIDLLRTYFQVEARDEARKIREKVTGKLVSLDRVLESGTPCCSSNSGLLPNSPASYLAVRDPTPSGTHVIRPSGWPAPSVPDDSPIR